MQADFLDAHERHWLDAEALAEVDRLANADHLYGLCAECGFKQLMLVFGMQYDTVKDRPSLPADRKHADGIWIRFESYRSGYLQGIDYTLPPSNPFDDWNASQRYAHQKNFNKFRVDAHKVGAETVRLLIKKAQNAGIL